MNGIFVGVIGGLCAAIFVSGAIGVIFDLESDEAFKREDRTRGQDLRTIAIICEAICIICLIGILLFVIAMIIIKLGG